jgi:uncharacterized membrane protein
MIEKTIKALIMGLTVSIALYLRRSLVDRELTVWDLLAAAACGIIAMGIIESLLKLRNKKKGEVTDDTKT